MTERTKEQNKQKVEDLIFNVTLHHWQWPLPSDYQYQIFDSPSQITKEQEGKDTVKQ